MGKKKIILVGLVVCLLFSFAACKNNEGVPLATDVPTDETSESEATQKPEEEQKGQSTIEEVKVELPDILSDGKDSVIKVYEIGQKDIVELSIQEYLYGVVGGEVGNDWPIEVLKAQAVIARTFMADHFINEEQSKYEGADISTDVSESQAYDADSINNSIKKAVDETAGMIIVYEDKPIKAFFFSCSGGITATAVEGLEHKEELPYIQVVESDDSNAPEDVRTWSGEFTKEKLQAALADMEEDIPDFDTIEIGEKGESGRVKTLIFGKSEVSCPQLRMAISASEFRSTLIAEISYEGEVLSVKGKGFGHGVGLPQWDAKQLCDAGYTFDQIILNYFKDVEIVKAWQ